jgi:hypothetical protein
VKKKSKITLLRVISSLLFILFAYQTKLPQNLSHITLNDYDARFAQVYDFCGTESVGYLKYVKKKYKLSNRPKIINYIHTPNLSWAIIEPRLINNYSDYKILLNYPGEMINLKFSIIEKNVYQIKKLNFYKNKTDRIEKLEIKFKNNFKYNKDIKVELYMDTVTYDKKRIKIYSIFSLTESNKIEFRLGLDLRDTRYENESITFKIKNLGKNKIENIKFVSLNKYNIKDYKIIDNYDRCYLIK